MQPIFPCELAEDDRVYLDSLHVLAAHQESHILKALEGVGEDVLLYVFSYSHSWRAITQSFHTPCNLKLSV